MAWFGKNKKNDALERPELKAAIRTMEDDLVGAPVNANTEIVLPEAPAQFVPEPGKGAPFYSSREGSGGETSSQTPKDVPLPTSSADTNRTESPFLVEGVSSPQEMSSRTVLSDEGMPVDKNDGVAPTKKIPLPLLNKKTIILGAVGLIICLFVGGGVYFFLTRSSSEPEVQAEPVARPTQSNNAPVVAPTVPIDLPTTEDAPRYSSITPNLLSLNTETVTAEGLHAQLVEVAGQVKESGMTGAVEFLVKDQNYNPLAFSRFVYLAKMNLTSDLLTLMDETFSLYIVLDQGRPHIGLVISVKDPVTFQKELAKGEKTLPQAINPLFIDTTTAPKTNLPFKSGSYAGLGTRYANVDSVLNLSVDYTTRNNEWFLGTSRDTLRAIVDKTALNVGQTIPTGPSPTQPSAPSTTPSVNTGDNTPTAK